METTAGKRNFNPKENHPRPTMFSPCVWAEDLSRCMSEEAGG